MLKSLAATSVNLGHELRAGGQWESGVHCVYVDCTQATVALAAGSAQVTGLSSSMSIHVYIAVCADGRSPNSNNDAKPNTNKTATDEKIVQDAS